MYAKKRKLTAGHPGINVFRAARARHIYTYEKNNVDGPPLRKKTTFENTRGTQINAHAGTFSTQRSMRYRSEQTRNLEHQQVCVPIKKFENFKMCEQRARWSWKEKGPTLELRTEWA